MDEDIESQLLDIMTTILVIQYACRHVGYEDSMVPRRCKGYSLEELHAWQLSLCAHMKELKRGLSNEQFRILDQAAHHAS